MESGPGTSQQARDVRRVLQVLLPSLPPPAIDLAMATISGSLASSKAQSRPSGRFRLRRMDSGDLGQLSLTSPIGRPRGAQKFSEPSAWGFSMAEQQAK